MVPREVKTTTAAAPIEEAISRAAAVTASVAVRWGLIEEVEKARPAR